MLQAALATLNPNAKHIHVERFIDQPKRFKLLVNFWTNVCQFVISPYAISSGTANKDSYLSNYAIARISKNKDKGYVNTYAMGSAPTISLQRFYCGQKTTLLHRALHLASLGALYILHQYSKNTAYGLIASMVFTKIASNAYVYYYRDVEKWSNWNPPTVVEGLDES